MCELFALSASEPVDVRLSLNELARHGGESNIHRDGWGVAFADGRDFRIFKEAQTASTSPWIQCLSAHPVRSRTVVAHIRHATRGAIASENTQPFARELGGMMRVFAHNGDLGVRNPRSKGPGLRFHPVGDTDSETAFCSLLNEAPHANDTAGPLDLETFGRFAEEARRQGPANFIYAEPERLLVHADRRRQYDATIAPPGLWVLHRHCAQRQVSSSPVTVDAAAETSVVLFASVPLTDERWIPLERGAAIEVSRGEIVRTLPAINNMHLSDTPRSDPKHATT